MHYCYRSYCRQWLLCSVPGRSLPFPMSQSPLCSFQDVPIPIFPSDLFLLIHLSPHPTQFLTISPSDLDCFFPCRPLEPEWSSSMSLKPLQGKYSAWYVVPLSKKIIIYPSSSWGYHHILAQGQPGLWVHGVGGTCIVLKIPTGKHGHTTIHWSIA